MLSINKIFTKPLYNFILFLSLIIFFFSTAKLQAKAFEIDNIEISRPFEINFDKNKVIDEGFKKAFLELLLLIVNSSDQKKIGSTKLNEIKGMIDSFSIKEEKFIEETYYVTLGVSFNKKEIFRYLEKKNIFPSIPIKNKFLFIPIVIDETNKDLLIFENNKIFDEWNNYTENFHLIDYILPSEDLEDLDLIKKKFDIIEKYNFKEIIDKYYLDYSIISLIFKSDNKVRVLSRITEKGNIILSNQSYSNMDINKTNDAKKLVKNLKSLYEDYWKKTNQINTSIKLPIYIKVKNYNNSKISAFEKTLENTDLIYDFFISKFNKDHIYFQIIYNGEPSNFLKTMSDNNFTFNTQNKVWILK